MLFGCKQMVFQDNYFTEHYLQVKVVFNLLTIFLSE